MADSCGPYLHSRIESSVSGGGIRFGLGPFAVAVGLSLSLSLRTEKRERRKDKKKKEKGKCQSERRRARSRWLAMGVAVAAEETCTGTATDLWELSYSSKRGTARSFMFFGTARTSARVGWCVAGGAGQHRQSLASLRLCPSLPNSPPRGPRTHSQAASAPKTTSCTPLAW